MFMLAPVLRVNVSSTSVLTVTSDDVIGVYQESKAIGISGETKEEKYGGIQMQCLRFRF